MKKEFKIGLTVMLAVAMFFLSLYFIGQLEIKQKGKEYYLDYTFLNNLSIGAVIKIAGGVECGEVTNFEIRGRTVRVTVWIENWVEVTDTTRFVISESGLIGRRYIQIKYAEDPGEELPPGSIIKSKDPADLTKIFLSAENIIGKIDDLIPQKGEDKGVEEFLGDITDSVSGINEFIGRLNKITEKTGKQIDTILTSVTDGLNLTEEDGKISSIKKIDGLIDDVRNFVNDTNKSITEVKDELKLFSQNTQTLISNISIDLKGEIMTISNNLNNILKGINSVVNEAQGIVSNLEGEATQTFDVVQDEIRNLSKQVSTILSETEKFVVNVDKLVSGLEEDLSDDEKLLGALFNEDTKMINDLEETLENLKEITRKINESFLFSEQKKEKRSGTY